MQARTSDQPPASPLNGTLDGRAGSAHFRLHLYGPWCAFQAAKSDKLSPVVHAEHRLRDDMINTAASIPPFFHCFSYLLPHSPPPSSSISTISLLDQASITAAFTTAAYPLGQLSTR